MKKHIVITALVALLALPSTTMFAEGVLPTVSISADVSSGSTINRLAQSSVKAEKDGEVISFTDPSFGFVAFDVYLSVCPNISADQAVVWVPWRTRTINVLRNVELQGTSVVPDKFRAITTGKWQYLCVSPTGTTPMWLGELQSTDNLHRGNRVSAPTRIESSTPFSLSGLGFVFKSSDSANWLNHSVTFANYAPEIVGVYWGTDQVKGTADDITRTSGEATLPVNELYYVGPAVAGGAENQSALNTIRAYVEANNSVGNPFVITCTVELRVGNNLVARQVRELPFRGNAAVVRISDGHHRQVMVDGRANQLYYVVESEQLSDASWTEIGLPVLSGRWQLVEELTRTGFFRAFQ